jgi:hypothetical protein
MVHRLALCPPIRRINAAPPLQAPLFELLG